MREFLKGLDLDADAVDCIMAEHGKLMTKNSEKAATLAEQLKSGEKKTLEKLGLTENDDISSFVNWKHDIDSEDYKQFLVAKKNKETDGDRLKALSEQFDKLNTDHTASLARIADYERKEVLLGHGLSDPEDLEIYSIRIGKLTDDKTDFKGAADAYFKEHPYPKPDGFNKPPPNALTPAYIGRKNPKDGLPAQNLTQALFGGEKIIN